MSTSGNNTKNSVTAQVQPAVTTPVTAVTGGGNNSGNNFENLLPPGSKGGNNGSNKAVTPPPRQIPSSRLGTPVGGPTLTDAPRLIPKSGERFLVEILAICSRIGAAGVDCELLEAMSKEAQFCKSAHYPRWPELAAETLLVADRCRVDSLTGSALLSAVQKTFQ